MSTTDRATDRVFRISIVETIAYERDYTVEDLRIRYGVPNDALHTREDLLDYLTSSAARSADSPADALSGDLDRGEVQSAEWGVAEVTR